MNLPPITETEVDHDPLWYLHLVKHTLDVTMNYNLLSSKPKENAKQTVGDIRPERK